MSLLFSVFHLQINQQPVSIGNISSFHCSSSQDWTPWFDCSFVALLFTLVLSFICSFQHLFTYALKDGCWVDVCKNKCFITLGRAASILMKQYNAVVVCDHQWQLNYEFLIIWGQTSKYRTVFRLLKQSSRDIMFYLYRACGSETVYYLCTVCW